MTLLNITDDFMEDTLRLSVRKVPPTMTALVPKAKQRSSDYSGDTLIASDARKFLEIFMMQENKTYDFESDEIQGQVTDNNTFWPNAYDFESDERRGRVMDDNTIWPMSNMEECAIELFGNSSDISNNEDPLHLPLHTPCVGNYMVRGELNTPKRRHRLFPLVRPSLSPQMANEGHSRALLLASVVDSEVSGSRSRSTSGGTVEIHRLASPTSSSNVSHSKSKRTFSMVDYLVHSHYKDLPANMSTLRYRYVQIFGFRYTK